MHSCFVKSFVISNFNVDYCFPRSIRRYFERTNALHGVRTMAKQKHPQILTANDLIEGRSVFMSPEGWSTDVSRAMVSVTAEQAVELEALGARFVDRNAVVGPYLIDVGLETGAPVPLSRRERIRAARRR